MARSKPKLTDQTLPAVNEPFLKDEYLKLQDQYEDYDRRALQIKGWISTAAVAGFALGIDANKKIDSSTLLIIALIAGCFWYLETTWKLFQYAVADRIRLIEAHFRGDCDILITELHPFQIYNFWFRAYAGDEPLYEYEKAYRPKSRLKRLAEAGLQSFVHLPYSLIIVICIGQSVWQQLK